MPSSTPYTYHIVLAEQHLGPYDRRTLVGMRMKKVVDKHASLLRSDGYAMTMAQLLADRHEMAGHFKPSEPIKPEAAWPTFVMDCGGSLLRGGVLGFQGLCELRVESDKLRVTGQRKGRWFASEEGRIKIALSQIAWADAGDDPSVLALGLTSPLAGHTALSVTLPLADGQAVNEVLALIDKPLQQTP
jgi:hypothetical protein